MPNTSPMKRPENDHNENRKRCYWSDRFIRGDNLKILNQKGGVGVIKAGCDENLTTLRNRVHRAADLLEIMVRIQLAGNDLLVKVQCNANAPVR